MIPRLLILIVLWTTALNAGQIKTAVRAESAILVNMDNGAVIFEKNADQAGHPASITKIAVAWYILEKHAHRLDEKTTVSREAVSYSPVHLKRSNPEKHPSYRLEAGASNMHLQAGEVISIRSLLYGLMLVSGDDAANVLAEHFSGNVGQFMNELNNFLIDKGVENTWFTNPAGFHHDDHKTTARDMALIASLAMKNPIFRNIVATQSYERPASNKQQAVVLKQSNRLLVPGRYYYPKAIGIKTGHLQIARFTLVAAAQQGDRTLLAVLLKCNENEDRYRDAKLLFEAAFSEKKISRVLLTKDHEHFRLKVPGAKQLLVANMQNDLRLEYFPSEEPQMRSIVNWHIPQLPIESGQNVGEVILLDALGNILDKEILISRERIEPTAWKRISLYGKKVLSAPMTIPILTMIGAVTISAGGVLIIFRRRRDGDKK